MEGGISETPPPTTTKEARAAGLSRERREQPGRLVEGGGVDKEGGTPQSPRPEHLRFIPSEGQLPGCSCRGTVSAIPRQPSPRPGLAAQLPQVSAELPWGCGRCCPFRGDEKSLRMEVGGLPGTEGGFHQAQVGKKGMHSCIQSFILSFTNTSGALLCAEHCSVARDTP